MIVTRTPLRISFCGGGSDIPLFYEKHGGCVISTTINKYVYLAIHNSFYPDDYILKYSKSERVKDVSEIEHPIFRECIRQYVDRPVEITSMADVPAGTGMGSSSSFTVGLIHALRLHMGLDVTKEYLASGACDVEITRLGEPIGKQDQYAAAYGGLNYYRFNKDGTVNVEPLRITDEEKGVIESSMMVFYTGMTRSASKILSEQRSNISKGSAEENQLQLCKLTDRLRSELESGKTDSLGKILDSSWKLKKKLAKGITNPEIDLAYETAMDNGALGGKLLGAGGGGFLMMIVPPENQSDVERGMQEYKRMPVSFDTIGSTQIYNDRNFPK